MGYRRKLKVNLKEKVPYKEKKITTSKVLLYLVIFICFLFLSFIVYSWSVSEDKSGAAELAGIFAVPAIAVIVGYLNKSKAENLLKIRKSLLEETFPGLDPEETKDLVLSKNSDFIDKIDEQIVELYENTKSNLGG